MANNKRVTLKRRKITTPVSKNRLDKIFELLRTTNSGAEAISRQPGVELSPSQVERIMRLTKYHGEAAVYEYFCQREKRIDYSDADFAAIASYAHIVGTTAENAALIFKASRKRVDKAIKALRANPALLVTPASSPEGFDPSVDHLKAMRPVKKNVLPIVNPEPLCFPTDGPAHACCLSDIETHDVDEHQSIAPVSYPTPIMGHAKFPSFNRGQKKMRCKSIEAAKKIEKEMLAQAQGSNKQEYVEPEVVWKLPDNVLEVERVDPKSFTLGRRGPVPRFDTNSPDFAKLPEKVKTAVYKKKDRDYQAYMFASKKIDVLNKKHAYHVKGLTCSDKAHLRYEACNEVLNEINALSAGVTKPSKDIVYRCFGFTYQSFFQHKKLYADSYAKKQSQENELQHFLLEQKQESFNTYGKRRHCALLFRKGIAFSIPTVARYMKKFGIEAFIPKAKPQRYNSFAGAWAPVPNHVKRNFDADTPMSLILTDVSLISIGNHRTYLSAFIDCCTREIVAYTLCDSDRVDFVVEGLKRVIKHIPEGQRCVIHSDQGKQYQHYLYQQLFKDNPNLTQSMSRKGNCYDNGGMESFFGHLKHDVEAFILAAAKEPETKDEFRALINEAIRYYNVERIQVKKGGLSPLEYKASLSKANNNVGVA